MLCVECAAFYEMGIPFTWYHSLGAQTGTVISVREEKMAFDPSTTF